MIVNLTQEQIDFLYGLCRDVEDDYELYSVKQQKEREEMADSIIGPLLNAQDGYVDEEELDEAALQYANKKWSTQYKSISEIKDELDLDVIEDFKAGYKEAKNNVIY